ncbi:chemotaxis protein CheW [Rhodococcus sp. X156]|uniref:chemotaxis protein CheW n=1 Tax=Rhodococcus sp. X156 TaxID=2499145 RepID=UPI000FD8044B|nr:chemotaxis protein CheW [Rhodococcus sp. X156]
MSSTQLATFWLGESLYGVGVDRVREVLRHQALTRVPGAPAAIAGLLNLRGQVVTAVDLRTRLQLSPRPAELAPMLVVVLVAGECVALLVDRVGAVVEVDESSFEPLPDTVRGVGRDLVLGAHKLDDHLVLSLDVAAAVTG